MKKTVLLTMVSVLSGCMLPTSQIIEKGDGNLKIKVINPLKKFQNSSEFRIKALKPEEVFYGSLSISGKGIVSPLTDIISPNPVRLLSGNFTSSDIIASSVPTGKNRIIKVTPMDNNQVSLGSHLTIMGISDVVNKGLLTAEISWNTTPSAKVIENLISLNSSYVDTLNGKELQKTVDKIINNGTPGNTLDDIHPSLVNASNLATHINNNSGNFPTLGNTSEISNYRISPQTISGNVSNITYSIKGINQTNVNHIAPVTLICNDPASNQTIITDTSGNYTISGVTPGSGYKVSLSSDYYQSASVNNISSGSTNVNFNPTALHYLPHSINSSYGIRRFRTDRAIKIQVITPTGSIGYNSTHRNAVTSAINMWQNLAGDKLSFNVLPDIADNDPNIITKKTEADIYIQWTQSLGAAVGYALPFPDVSSTSIPPSGGSFIPNFSTMPYNTEMRVAIALATKDGFGNFVPELSLAPIAAHELGHAFGIATETAGTSNPHPQTDVTDLMYPSVNFSLPTNLNVSERDLNTLRFLYGIPANLTRN